MDDNTNSNVSILNNTNQLTKSMQKIPYGKSFT